MDLRGAADGNTATPNRVAESRRTAVGTRPIYGPAGCRGAIAVLADDRVERLQICTHVRARDFVALPVATGLDAVLALERAHPVSAIVASTALGAPAHEILDFLETEYPHVHRVLLGRLAHARSPPCMTNWAPDLAELDAVLDSLSPRGY